jgi:hypothetical protein
MLFFYFFVLNVILNVVKNLGSIKVDVHEILPPFGRLNDRLEYPKKFKAANLQRKSVSLKFCLLIFK